MAEEEIYAIDGLLCFGCRHDLNHYMYQIFQHPGCNSIPYCLPCIDSLDIEEVDWERPEVEICFICRQGGELVECTECLNWYCMVCIQTCFPEIKDIDNISEKWLCVNCDYPVRDHFADLINQAKLKSLYATDRKILFNSTEVETQQKKLVSLADAIENHTPVNGTPESQQLCDDIYSRMLTLRNGIKEANEKLLLVSLIVMFNSIVSELCPQVITAEFSIEEMISKASDELMLYITYWEQHRCILEAQEEQDRIQLYQEFKCMSREEFLELDENESSGSEVREIDAEIVAHAESGSSRSVVISYIAKNAESHVLRVLDRIQNGDESDVEEDGDAVEDAISDGNEGKGSVYVSDTVENLLETRSLLQSMMVSLVNGASEETAPNVRDKAVVESLLMRNVIGTDCLMDVLSDCEDLACDNDVEISEFAGSVVHNDKYIRLLKSVASSSSELQSQAQELLKYFIDDGLQQFPLEILISLPSILLITIHRSSNMELESLVKILDPTLPAYMVIILFYMRHRIVDAARNSTWSIAKDLHCAIINALLNSEDYYEKKIIQEQYSAIIPSDAVECDDLGDVCANSELMNEFRESYCESRTDAQCADAKISEGVNAGTSSSQKAISDVSVNDMLEVLDSRNEILATSVCPRMGYNSPWLKYVHAHDKSTIKRNNPIGLCTEVSDTKACRNIIQWRPPKKVVPMVVSNTPVKTVNNPVNTYPIFRTPSSGKKPLIATTQTDQSGSSQLHISDEEKVGVKRNLVRKRVDVVRILDSEDEDIESFSDDDDGDDDPSPKKKSKKLYSVEEMEVEEEDNLFDVVYVEETKCSNEKSQSSSSSYTNKKKSVSNETKMSNAREKDREKDLQSFVKFSDEPSQKSTEMDGELINSERPPNDPEVCVPSFISKFLKVHQVRAVKFLWANVIHSVSALEKFVNGPNEAKRMTGRGCVLAHCMGLGKTLSVIAFVVSIFASSVIRELEVLEAEESDVNAENSHSENAGAEATQSTSPEASTKPKRMVSLDTKRLFHRIMIVVPVNVLPNWSLEFKKWNTELKHLCLIHVLDSGSSTKAGKKYIQEDRMRIVERWFTRGGVLLIGYDMLRILAGAEEGKASKSSKMFRRYLLNPGPDIIIADEAHIIKNPSTKIAIILSEVRTPLRIALTGSPLQNNLMEYWCMIHWARPYYLGNIKEFQARFERPIKEGENRDATKHQRKLMNQRSYLLHKRLRGVVEREDFSTLAKDLPGKREFVVVLKMTPIQKFLYKNFMILAWSVLAQLGKESGKRIAVGRMILTCFQGLQRIYNHPAFTIMQTFRAAGNDPELSQFWVRGTEKGSKLDRVRTELSLLFHELKCSEERNEAGVLDKALDAAQANYLEAKRRAAGEIPLTTSTSTSDRMDDMEMDMEEETSGDSVIPVDWWKKLITSTVEIKSQVSGRLKKSQSKWSSSSSSIKSWFSKEREDMRNSDDELFDSLSDGEENESFVKESDSLSTSNGSVELLTMKAFMEAGNKISAMLYILIQSVLLDDKVVIFSQSLLALDFMEMILKQGDWWQLVNMSDTNEFSMDMTEEEKEKFSRWVPNRDYYRIDGSTNAKQRQANIDEFNGSNKAKAFLISTKAGNMGINLHTANRVILFDTSWNPAHDLQAMFRVYRYGQRKSVFVYRLVTAGSMEEKIYRKQVVKKSLSNRVVDQQCVENHFTAEEREFLMEYVDDEAKRGLYISSTSAVKSETSDAKPVSVADEVHNILYCNPQDSVLQRMVTMSKLGRDIILEINDDSVLLADVEEEHLNEDEQRQAEVDYDNEVRGVSSYAAGTAVPPVNPPSAYGLYSTDIIARMAAGNGSVPVEENNNAERGTALQLSMKLQDILKSYSIAHSNLTTKLSALNLSLHQMRVRNITNEGLVKQAETLSLQKGALTKVIDLFSRGYHSLKTYMQTYGGNSPIVDSYAAKLRKSLDMQQQVLKSAALKNEVNTQAAALVAQQANQIGGVGLQPSTIAHSSSAPLSRNIIGGAVQPVEHSQVAVLPNNNIIIDGIGQSTLGNILGAAPGSSVVGQRYPHPQSVGHSSRLGGVGQSAIRGTSVNDMIANLRPHLPSTAMPRTQNSVQSIPSVVASASDTVTAPKRATSMSDLFRVPDDDDVNVIVAQQPNRTAYPMIDVDDM